MSDSSPQTDRLIIESSRDQQGRLGRLRDTLSEPFRQAVQTKTSTPTLSLFRSGVNTVEPASGVDEYYEVYKTTAVVFASIWNYASDVWGPGYRIEAANDEAAEWLEEKWLPQAAILHGGKRNDFLPFGKHTTIQRWARGGALIEHVRADPDDPESPITGLNFIPPETVSFVPYTHKPILVDPDPPSVLADDLPAELPETRRGEQPAYIQYHRNAPIPTKRDPIPLSQNDVTRTIYNGDAAGVGTDLDQFWGTPVTEIIAEDVAGFKNIMRDKEEAIKNKAYGLWQLAFSREVLEYQDVDDTTGETIDMTEIIEWSDDDKQSVADEIENQMGPGSVLTHDGNIEMDRLDGDVPDLIDDLEFYISEITAALPTPLFIVGFETNINQFVVEGQDARYQKLIQWEREELERTYSKVVEQVLETHDDAPESEWVKFKIEPPVDDSPIMSMSDAEIDRLLQWAEAFHNIRGDIPVDMFIDPEVLRTDILQLPDGSGPDVSEILPDEREGDIDQAARDLEELMGGLDDSPPPTDDDDPEDRESVSEYTPAQDD